MYFLLVIYLFFFLVCVFNEILSGVVSYPITVWSEICHPQTQQKAHSRQEEVVDIAKGSFFQSYLNERTMQQVAASVFWGREMNSEFPYHLNTAWK